MVTTKQILLVCEGETDVYIFQALAEHFSNSKKNLTIKSLSPHQDATSGTYPSHSFGHVLNWCLDHRIDQYDEDSIDVECLIDFTGANALLIQMDTDIAHKANPSCTAIGLYSARHCCHEKLNQQFGTTKEPKNCYYILPTQNTETWLLACNANPIFDCLSNPISNFELITDVEQKLISFGYPSKKGKSKNAPRRLNKHPAKKYKEYGTQLTQNLIVAKERCPELNKLCDILESI